MNVSIRVLTPTVATQWSVPIAPSLAPRVDFELGKDSRVTVAGVLTPQALAVSRSDAAASVSPAVAAPFCSSDKAGAYVYGLSEHFANAYGWAAAKATIKETAASSHRLGAGISVDAGPFKADGTVTFETHTSAGGEQSAPGNDLVFNRINYRHFTRYCIDLGRKTTYDEVRPVSVYDLISKFLAVDAPIWSTCVTKTSGHYWKSAGTNSTDEAGITFSGASLSAQSGWDTDTEVGWNITSPSLLCGSDERGWSASSEAAARPR